MLTGAASSAFGQALPAAPLNCGLTLSGQVLDHETRQPLPGATVVVLDAATAQPVAHGATTTDGFGNYHLHDLCAGAVRVRVLFVGYADDVSEVKLTRPMVLNPQLHPSAVQLQSAVVRGTRLAPLAAPPTATLSAADLRATRGQTLGEALTRLSGVSAIQTGPSIYKPMLHGLHSNRITMLNNGVRQEGQQWGQEHGPEIDPFIASELSVVKGAATVRYGSDAIGGVILVKPAPLRDSAGVGGAVQLVAGKVFTLGAAGYVVLPSEATYFACVDLAASGITEDDRSFADRAVAQAGVAVIPLSPFAQANPPRGFVRLCFAKQDATIDTGIAAMARARGQGALSYTRPKA